MRPRIVPFPAAIAVALIAADFNPADIARRALPAVVAIRVKGAAGEASGSGFIVDATGTIVTNLHVIRGATSVAVRTPSGDIYDQIKVRAFDERKDLAVIQMAAFGLPTLRLGDSDALQPGQRVVLVGNALGVLEGSVSTGVVSGIRRMDGYKVIQTDATANHGNSGGPMLSESGEVVGVLTFKVGEGKAENLNFAVPINYVRGMLMSSDSFSLVDLGTRLGKTADLFASGEGSFPTKWKSLTSGATTKLRIDGDHLYADTVVTEEQRQAGWAFTIAELKKAGDRYVGVERVRASCSYMGFDAWLGRKQKFNQCSLEIPIEISSLSATRIEGRLMSYDKFDCGKCTFKAATGWQSFAWIPEQ